MSTQEERDILAVYLQEAGESPLLNKEEEIQLAKRIELGGVAQEKFDKAKEKNPKLTLDQRPKLATVINDGHQARQTLITSNLRLVISIAKGYLGSPSLNLLDLIQEGNLALFHAV